MSFDIVQALTHLDSKPLAGEEMYRAFKAVRGEYWRDLPIEFDVDDLFELAQKHHLVKVLEDGRLQVDLKQHRQSIKRDRLKAMVKDQVVALIVREAKQQRQPMWNGSTEEETRYIKDEVMRLANVLIING